IDVKVQKWKDNDWTRMLGAAPLVLNALRQPKFDQMTVEIELGTLKDVANQCVKHSKEMDDEFTTWLYFIMELHESCQNEEGRGTELFQDIVSQEKAQTVYQEEQNKMLAEHKKKVEEMEKKVKEAHELYQKLHDEFPTGDSLVKQQLIMLAGETASSLLKIAGTAAAVYVSPMSAFPLGADAAKDLNDKVDEGNGKSSGKTGKDDSKDNKEDSTKKTETEPALARCPTVLMAVEALDDILDEKVDWNRILPVTNTEKGKDEEKGNGDTEKPTEKRAELDIIGIDDMLSKTKKFIEKSPDERKSASGKKLLTIIKNTGKTIDQIKAERKKAGDVKSWEKPKDDSKLVRGWVKAVTESLLNTKKLQAKFKASGGGSAGQPHLVYKVDDNQKEQIQARTDLTKATIENAKAHLKIALEGYLAQQEAARKMNETTIRMQQELATVRREIAQLGEQKVTLEEVRRVLRDCITFLIQLKAKVKDLTSFFTKVATLISSAVLTHVTPLSKYIEGTTDKLIKGNFIIMQYALDVAADFSLYQDIADMYMAVNDNHILEGLAMVDEMGKMSKADELETKRNKLQGYSKSAMEGITDIITKKTESVCAGSQKRVAELKALLEHPDLPPSWSQQEDDAIKEGAKEAIENNSIVIERNNAAINQLTKPKEVRDENMHLLV
ncbi:hypothetical protein IWW34DRAFT_888025, partial [Fusarium oxysporum f. sp. albedinis]